MPIRMIATFKQFKVGSIVDPDQSTTEWLISRQYAVPAPAVIPSDVVEPSQGDIYEPKPRRGRK